MKTALNTKELQALLPTFDVSLLEKTEVHLTPLNVGTDANSNGTRQLALTVKCGFCTTDEIAATMICTSDEVALASV